MNQEMEQQIEKADIPAMLKNYFVRNHYVHIYLTESLLKEIEESYVEYDSLYEFDDAEFSAYVITGLKNQDKHKYFYHYLKKILESNLKLVSKSPVSGYSSQIKLAKGISNLPEGDILVIIKNLLLAIQDFNSSKELGSLLRAFKLAGELEILLTLYPDNEYKEDYYRIFDYLLTLTL